MRDPPPVGRPAHVLLVDVIGGEVPGDSGEQVDVAFAHRLREAHLVADGEVEFSHGSLPPAWIATLPPLDQRSARYDTGGRSRRSIVIVTMASAVEIRIALDAVSIATS